MDVTKKIILYYNTSPDRDTQSAIYALNDVLSKLKEITKILYTCYINSFSFHNINLVYNESYWPY